MNIDPQDPQQFGYSAVYASKEGVYLAVIGGQKAYIRVDQNADDWRWRFDWTWFLPVDAVMIWKQEEEVGHEH